MAELAKLKSLQNKREKYFGRLQALYDIAKKCYDVAQSSQALGTDVDVFISRYQKLENDVATFEQISEEISLVNMRVVVEERIDTHKPSLAYDELYFNIKTYARKLGIDEQIKVTPPPVVSGSISSPSAFPQARLPKLEIDAFDGTISNWPNFYSLYNTLIHRNKSLSKVEKLTYLRSLLKSHALALIETLAISEENYDIAMHLLVQRYQNKRLLAANYLDKIFSFRPLLDFSAKSLHSFLEVFNTNLAALRALNVEDLFDLTMLHVGLRVLTPSARKEFEIENATDSIPRFDNLIKFVHQQVRILELMHPEKPQKHKSMSSCLGNNKPTYSSARSTLLSTVNSASNRSVTKSEYTCPMCTNTNHKIYACTKFKELSIEQRHEFVKKNSLCFNCLGFHRIASCKSTAQCFYCKKGHHSLLHLIKVHSPPANPAIVHQVPSAIDMQPSSSQVESLSCAVVGSSSLNLRVMLCTAIIGLIHFNGKLCPVRAVIDSGSQTSLITEACAQKLRLPRKRAQIGLIAVANATVAKNRGFVNCSISPVRNDKIVLNTNALVLNEICGDQPNQPIDVNISKRFANLILADPLFAKNAPIEFLVGSDLYMEILENPPSIIQGYPGAISTIFGWMIGGKLPEPVPPLQASALENPTTLFLCCESLDSSIRRFWETEEVQCSQIQSPDDIVCENLFLKTHSRDENGRYVVRLPFKQNPELPATREHARKRLINLEGRLRRQPTHYEEYRRFMNEYIDLGHMSLATSPSNYIIPHHCVFKDSSSTTKVRTVFDASFNPGSTSKSLNDFLLVGPKLQRDISDIICSFRLRAVVVCCDVRQMYRQVLVHTDDRKYQHIYYRPEEGRAIQEYVLNTVTFGVSSSPFLAQRVLQQLVKDEGTQFPIASKAILNQTFVDDICESVDTVEEALILQKELINIFEKAGFSLRKWASNQDALLDAVPLSHREHPLSLNSEDHSIKILGVQYEPTDDCFSYSICSNPIVQTKRSMLSEIAKIYDPVGWLTPLTFYAKVLIQRSWILGLSWDEPLPLSLQKMWTIFVIGLPALASIKIPRYIPVLGARLRQIIGFCDGSSKGYGAVVYIRCENDNEIVVNLVKAKSKVAPLKTMSIPRIELSAALLLSRIIKSITSLMDQIQPTSIHLFSDSAIVLAWLRTPPHKLKTFVANRVVQILDNTLHSYWFHIASKENPSDCASRGLTPQELSSFYFWWKGPAFLYELFNSWPTFSMPSIPLDPIPEIKVETLAVTLPSVTPILELISYASNLTRVQRIVAFMLRFLYNARCNSQNSPPRIGPLVLAEIKEAMFICVKEVQQNYLKADIIRIASGEPCSRYLQKLTPFLDDRGLLRVGGRLENSSLSYDAKHPLVIPKESNLAVLICDHYHRMTLHGGPRLCQSHIQRRYWIISIRQLIRKRINQCLPCYKMKVPTINPQMANLPSARVQLTRPFLSTGIDFAGPWILKESPRRKSPRSKYYMAIFICLATKAIHLELVSSLSTTAFLAALDRFVARRGLCRNIYSDCGTNFKGASNYYTDVTNFLKSGNNVISDHLSLKEITWNFNPPLSPHFGGLWEAGVKSAKHHLHRMMGTLVLTYEEMATLLAKVEAILNSRPLGSLPVDPHDNIDFLTPGHFLIGSSMESPPEINVEDTSTHLLNRYQLLQQCTQAFWRRWSQDYLHTLTPKVKWNTPQPNLQLGEVVFIKEKDTLPLSWPIGRIIELFPGKDGVVRIVKVRTTSGCYIRPTCKMIPLPPLP